MKLVFIIGDAAVGKMTVGRELMKITDLRLFHNHMTIEPVLEIFGEWNSDAIKGLRDVVFREYAKSGKYGLIFTYMFAFNLPSEYEYLRHVEEACRENNPDVEVYFVELNSPLEVRIERNKSESRLAAKPSKRDLETSEARLLNDDKNYRMVSYPGEMEAIYENYLRIENSNMPAEEAARVIKEHFGL
ncbi:MAG: AAA family ATPase [Oscillospiraceae bacterium]|nr:AAA family ATPase [Oscillospiraceae bacterium]